MLVSSVRDRAREYINSRPELIIQQLQATSSKNKYICPFCGSGTGKNHTAAFSYEPNTRKFKCFSCMQDEPAADTLEMLERLENRTESEILSIYAGYSGDASEWATAPGKREAAGAAADQGDGDQSEGEPETDYTEFFKQAAANITNTSYHRGISLDTLQRFMIGYAPSWRHSKAPAAVPATPRLIIPTSRYSYIARDTRAADQIPETGKAYTKMKEGKTRIFNTKAITEGKAVFVVEGELDALSIIDVGGAAVGLGSISNVRLFLQAAESAKKAAGQLPAFIIALDNEDKPQVKAAAEKLQAGLNEMGAKSYMYADLWREYKDANEMLQGDRSRLQAIVTELSGDPGKEKAEYMSTFADQRTDVFESWIKSQTEHPYTPTGFTALDAALEGGVYNSRLYAIGAISSLGKTTFTMQIADNIAKSGRDVLIFSLEMGEFELYAKSISRLTYEITQRAGGDIRNCKTELGVMLHERWKEYSPAELELIQAAMTEHKAIGKHKKVLSGLQQRYTTAAIREAVKRHISFTGCPPVVVVDYLQILAYTGDRPKTDKQRTDDDITELKLIAEEFNTPVIVISSLNRANYKASIGFEAFKESGTIEYSVDVLIGLQLHGAGRKDFNVDQAKQKDPREIELVILKQRAGKTGLKIGYEYRPLFNYFSETGEITNDHYKSEGDQSGAQISPKAFKEKWNDLEIELSGELSSGDFAAAHTLECMNGLLKLLDKSDRTFVTYSKKYLALKTQAEKKAEKKAGKQLKMTAGDAAGA